MCLTHTRIGLHLLITLPWMQFTRESEIERCHCNATWGFGTDRLRLPSYLYPMFVALLQTNHLLLE